MKRFLILVFVFLFQIVSAQNNAATVRYKITVNKDSLKNASDVYVKSMVEHSSPVYALLDFNKTASLYFLEGTLSELYNAPINLAKSFGGSTTTYYYNQESKEYLRESHLQPDPLIIKGEPIHWTILENETKMIQGYLCVKAIRESEPKDARLKTKSRLEAWFCPDIPFSFGPERFHGLPGLVVQCSGSVVSFQMEKITWHTKPLKIDKPTGSEVLSEEEFRDRVGRF
ncbi:GLPGLI family protein [Pustulibacterium marinum]|nr:GLPGLI family protein [Pustulibacterium marinum]